jgi:hypothetical protein
MTVIVVVMFSTPAPAAAAGTAEPRGPQAPTRKTENVIFVMTDGLRWQEVFRGAKLDLIENYHGGEKAKGGSNVEQLKQSFWRETPEERRRALLPFLWTVVAKEGQVFGNQDAGSVARVTNGFNFSYPGYSEALCGFADPRIDSNDPKPNPNVTVLEWLNGKPQYHDRVAAFTSWERFGDILNVRRSGMLVNSGYAPVPNVEDVPALKLLNRLVSETPQPGEETRYDAFTFHAAREYLLARKPRVLYVSFDETDEQAHRGRYDRVLADAHKVDGYVRELWELAQSLPEYKGKTTLMFSTDHGRGVGPIDWRDHGQKIPASQFIWFAALGPDTPALGERRDTEELTQGQIAATLAAFLGEDYAAAVPKAAKPVRLVP